MCGFIFKKPRPPWPESKIKKLIDLYMERTGLPDVVLEFSLVCFALF